MADRLPQEIALDIFSRLSAESVLNCKFVCRAWNNILRFHAHTIYFSNQHVQLQHHKKYDSQMMSFVAFDRDDQAFWYLESHVDGYNEALPDYWIKFKTTICCVKTINMKFPCVGRLGLIGSDNGLICLSLTESNDVITAHRNKLADSAEESLCICNPITREFVTLPGTLKMVDGVHFLAGFGYHPLTNQYKVVIICYEGNPESPFYEGHAGVCVNGALHWLCDDSADIMVFDLAEEKFHLLPAPVEEIHDFRRIYVMRRCLCYEYYEPPDDDTDSDELLRLCFLEKNNEEEDNISNYYVNAPEYYKSWSWNKEFTVQLKHFTSGINIRFFDTKMCELVLLTNGRDHVLRYNKQPIKRIKLDEVTRDWNLEGTTTTRQQLRFFGSIGRKKCKEAL